MKTEGEQKDYTHLSDFLKKHINRSSKVAKGGAQSAKRAADDTISQISKKNKFSNALIEKASQEIRDSRSATQAESTAGGDYQNLQSAFLRGKRDGDALS